VFPQLILLQQTSAEWFHRQLRYRSRRELQTTRITLCHIPLEEFCSQADGSFLTCVRLMHDRLNIWFRLLDYANCKINSLAILARIADFGYYHDGRADDARIFCFLMHKKGVADEECQEVYFEPGLAVEYSSNGVTAKL